MSKGLVSAKGVLEPALESLLHEYGREGLMFIRKGDLRVYEEHGNMDLTYIGSVTKEEIKTNRFVPRFFKMISDYLRGSNPKSIDDLYLYQTEFPESK